MKRSTYLAFNVFCKGNKLIQRRDHRIVITHVVHLLLAVSSFCLYCLTLRLSLLWHHELQAVLVYKFFLFLNLLHRDLALPWLAWKGTFWLRHFLIIDNCCRCFWPNLWREYAFFLVIFNSKMHHLLNIGVKEAPERPKSSNSSRFFCLRDDAPRDFFWETDFARLFGFWRILTVFAWAPSVRSDCSSSAAILELLYWFGWISLDVYRRNVRIETG